MLTPQKLLHVLLGRKNAWWRGYNTWINFTPLAYNMSHTCPTHMANLQVISHSPWPHSLSSHTLGCLALLTSNSSSRRHLPSSPSHLNAKITSFELISPSLDAQLTSQSLPRMVLGRPMTSFKRLATKAFSPSPPNV